MELTHEQKEKLQKLEKELAQKKEYEEKNRHRKEKTSETTGIPYNMIDLDVVKFATMFGMIKSRAVREGKEIDTSGSSLLTTLLGGTAGNSVDYSSVPSHFRLCQKRTTEADRIGYHQDYVQSACDAFSRNVKGMIIQEFKNLHQYIEINVDKFSIDDFKSSVQATIEIVFENLEDEDDDELWDTLSLLRNSLLGALDVCEYSAMVKTHIEKLKKMKKSRASILAHLSWNDGRLSCYPGFQCKTGVYNEYFRIYRALEIKSFTRDPSLQPFDFVKNCCIPTLMMVSVLDVLSHGLLGPYRNNSIGYLALDPKAFYIIGEIKNGIRYWMLDNSLVAVSDKISTVITKYLITLFRTFYRQCFGDRVYRSKCVLTSFTAHADVFRMLLANLDMVNHKIKLHTYLKDLVRRKSPIIPTEYDVFNSFVYEKPKLLKPGLTRKEILSKLFDGVVPDEQIFL